MATKNSMIIRVDNEKILFQSVNQFERISREAASNATLESKFGFSAWDNSGDILKAQFENDSANLLFCLRYLNFEIKSNSTGTIQMHEFDKLKKGMKNCSRAQSKLNELADENMRSLRSTSKALVIKWCLDVFNIVGGTVRTECGDNWTFTHIGKNSNLSLAKKIADSLGFDKDLAA